MKRALLLALVLAGCATDPYMSEAQQDQIDDYRCAQRGAPAGSADYAACRNALTMERAAFVAEETARQATFRARMQALANDTPPSGPPMRSPPANPNEPMRMGTTCFARGEADAGMNKICYYDCLGSTFAVTQSLVSLCPLTIQR